MTLAASVSSTPAWSRLLWLAPLVLMACEPTDKAPELGASGVVDDPASDDADGDGFIGAEDCNDGDASVGPGMVEVCDGVDNNCDGAIDEGVMQQYYADADADGFGDPDTTLEACAQPSGAVPNSNDCDDDDADVFPGATETCNGVDDNCSGDIDEGLGATWYPDADSDGYGRDAGATEACDPGDGWVQVGGDCDDDDPDAFPGNPEVCDEVDNDCDTDVDEGLMATYYVDFDGDGWGDAGSVTEACREPTGYADQAGDCDDANLAVNPDATEVCNGLDDDCDGATDEADAADMGTWVVDSDGDGFGGTTTTTACEAPSGYIAAGGATDCDDSNPSVYPGATETCDGEDDDCDGTIDESDAVDAATWYLDADADGYGSTSSTVSCSAPSGYVSAASDCDDTDASISPAATEVCNEVDDDCDGDIDDADSSLVGASTWYADLDGDAYGDPTGDLDACEAPTSYVADDTDCDDADASVNPGAAEICNGADDDCDGVDDNGVLGTGAACPAEDCAEILADNPSAADGSYELDLGTYTCDMTTDGGGWTLVGDGATVYGTGYTGTYYNTEGFYWTEALFTYNSGSSHAHCTYPTSLTGCNNIGMQFGSESWAVAANWGSSLCSLTVTTAYTSATTYIGGYDWVIDRSGSSDTIRVGTLEGIAACTTSDNNGPAYIDIWVRH